MNSEHWSRDKNSTLGSVVPLAMFRYNTVLALNLSRHPLKCENMSIVWVWSHNVQNSFFIIWNWLSTRYFRNIPFSLLLSPLQSALQQHQHQQYLLSKYLQLFAKVLYFVTSWHKKLHVFDKFFGHVFTSFCSVVYDLIILAEERTFHSAPSVLWTTIPWEEIKSNLFEILFVADKVFFCESGKQF